MSASDHSRDSSTSTVSNGSAYQLILEHVFSYPATYELPLRTVFAQNCEPRKHTMSAHNKPPSPHRPDFELQRQATADFTSSLVGHIAQLPSQPCSLPPVFITTFLRRCFPTELAEVDFPQALTGLDYLKDLETRRRRDHQAALRRIGITDDILRNNDDLYAIYCKHPGLESWMQNQVKQEKNIETSYTHLYIGLRRWILINELMIQPFNKSNCLAMLNTLFPPMTTSPPTSKLTAHQIKVQRDTYFKWINRVEAHYTKSNLAPHKVLEPLMQHSKREGDDNAWKSVRETLDMYLRAAQHLIDEYAEVQTPDDFGMDGRRKSSVSLENKKKKERKADSGISFGSNKRPSTSGSLSGATLVGDANKSQPHSPTATASANKERNYSTLERLARELRRMKASRNGGSRTETLADEAEKENWSHSRTNSNGSTGSMTGHRLNTSGFDASQSFPAQEPALSGLQKSKSLRKARSFSDMKRNMSPFGARKKDVASGEQFDEEEMRKQRALWEMNAGRKVGLRS
ncbi:hypothetical protein FH972_022911 [Carpinus fangiana]|uniref:Uncharacterized protein n=1 Tax=Carpinus fangiana TaxID=176857 RepID=A0A5N6KTM0_9ROSI|nr:hypothetical protein FH972_022911 [Carpinus fangiana]